MQEKNKTLWRYILPSAGAMCVTYLYNIVDGIFVGRGVGYLALAAVNITVPFITALVAISCLFAMGGSTVIAIRLGRGINGIASVMIYGVLCVFSTPAVSLFNSDPALVEMASGALPIFAFSFLFMSVNLIFTAYFYSTKQTVKSDVIAASRGIVIKALAVFLIPAVLGDGYVWWSAAAAEVVTLLIGLVFVKR